MQTHLFVDDLIRKSAVLAADRRFRADSQLAEFLGTDPGTTVDRKDFVQIYDPPWEVIATTGELLCKIHRTDVVLLRFSINGQVVVHARGEWAIEAYWRTHQHPELYNVLQEGGNLGPILDRISGGNVAIICGGGGPLGYGYFKELLPDIYDRTTYVTFCMGPSVWTNC